jgi:hypothetical protein
VDGTAVVGVRDALDQAVALEVVDQAGDVAWGRIELSGEVSERRGTALEEAEQDAKATLAEVMLVSPALLEVVDHPAGHANGSHGLDDAQIDLRRIDQLAHPYAVEAAGLVPGELSGVRLHSDFFHIE